MVCLKSLGFSHEDGPNFIKSLQGADEVFLPTHVLFSAPDRLIIGKPRLIYLLVSHCHFSDVDAVSPITGWSDATLRNSPSTVCITQITGRCFIQTLKTTLVLSPGYFRKVLNTIFNLLGELFWSFCAFSLRIPADKTKTGPGLLFFCPSNYDLQLGSPCQVSQLHSKCWLWMWSQH